MSSGPIFGAISEGNSKSGAVAIGQPLILTCELEPRAFAFFDGLRREHFPPERNLVPAHVSLFHKLPGEQICRIADRVGAACRAVGPLEIRVAGLRHLGRGVAFKLQSPELVKLRAELAEAFAEWLTPQDRQSYQPHITVQNKVSTQTATALLAQLQAGFAPWSFSGTGLALWHYRDGPWERAATFELSGSARHQNT